LVRACGIHGREENAYRIWWVNLEEKDEREDLSIEVSMILKLTLKKYTGEM
jgi:hypothetical protein